ncbi:MAG: AAA family ATPase, partial [Anaerolineae bacterium]|nr:AAA family ATPase [Anaerolineae bacterium]
RLILARAVWFFVTADPITIALSLTNAGRSPATNISVELLPGEDYKVLVGHDHFDRLPAGHAARLQFTLQPLTKKHLTPYFKICYDDREQSGKVQVKSATLQLLSIPETFTPIPNPYQPGRPLRHDSRTFVGREDVFSFIRDTLENAVAGQVLVLTGQRRMGKTSLSQRLSEHLQESYVAVYLDGQSLAIDPGLANFFLRYSITFDCTLKTT